MAIYKSARELLAAVVKRYGEVAGYADDGIVCKRNNPVLPSCWFETKYSKIRGFRFQFVLPHPYHPLRYITTKAILGADCGVAYFYRHFPRQPSMIEMCNSLASAINRAAGISQGTSRTIGKLLVPDVSGFSFLDIRRPRFRHLRVFDGVPCLCVSGLRAGRGRITIWIGAEDLLVRKVISHDMHQEEIRRNILINNPIHDDEFRLPEPAAAVDVEIRC